MRCFYVEENADRKPAGTPMVEYIEEVKVFLDRYLKQGQTLATEVRVAPLNRPKVSKKFKIKDYIKANFGD